MSLKGYNDSLPRTKAVVLSSGKDEAAEKTQNLHHPIRLKEPCDCLLVLGQRKLLVHSVLIQCQGWGVRGGEGGVRENDGFSEALGHCFSGKRQD